MRFALVNNERVEAQPKLTGLCPGCSQPVVAKCGERRIRHWAHHTKVVCDNWWETETQWHRDWKNNFPDEWQEIVLYDEQTGEKHIADIRTSHGLVIEFQRSPIDPQERAAREHFYRNMAWVVDGTRLKKDYPKFLKRKSRLRPHAKKGCFLLPSPEQCFPVDWVGSSVPVFFDFRGTAQTDLPDGTGEPLWCLLPGRAEGLAVVIEITCTGFVARSSSHSQLLPAQEIVSSFAEELRQQAGKDLMELVTEIEAKMQLLWQREQRRQTTRRF